jgi:hypothetical protein
MFGHSTLRKGTVTYGVYFYALISVGSLSSIVFSVRDGHYLSSLHAIGLVLVIFAIGFTVLRGDLLQTDVRNRASETDSETNESDDRAPDLPFSAGFWEMVYNNYVDRAEFKRVEIGMYVVGILALGVVQVAVKLGI